MFLRYVTLCLEQVPIRVLSTLLKLSKRTNANDEITGGKQ